MSAPTAPIGGRVRSLKWTCEQDHGALHIALQGDIDENASLYELKAVLSGAVRIDLGGVRRINSAGVRDWVNFIREAGDLASPITLSNCSPAIVMQMNMIANFRGGASVESIYAPFACPTCDREQDSLLVLSPEALTRLPEELPPVRCEQCGAAMELDDIPERYFAFLKLSTT